MVDSIIIYRNPLEQVLWNNIMLGGEWVSLMLSIVLITIGTMIAYHLLLLLGKKYPRLTWFNGWKHPRKLLIVSIILGIIIGKLIKVFFTYGFPMILEFLIYF